MPELAEVEYYRKIWDPGRGSTILRVEMHTEKRIFRGCDTQALEDKITGAKLLGSQAHGKQMLFEFSGGGWLGIHLGMSGTLLRESPAYPKAKHDHLILRQKKQCLVFRDPRQFGRVRFDVTDTVPEWWSGLPPQIPSRKFTAAYVREFLRRHRRAPLKAVLLDQEGFPGIGNWMADEVLWQARLDPAQPSSELTEAEAGKLWKAVRQVVQGSLKTVGKDYSDPPDSWLFRHRWKADSYCPRCGITLERDEIGGRTTCWCGNCQKTTKSR